MHSSYNSFVSVRVLLGIKSLCWTCFAYFLTFSTFFCISIRSPGSVAPRDVECEGFGITYPRIASDNKSSRPAGTASIPDPLENDVDKKVDDAIESFLRKLTQIGPELMSVCSNT